MEGIAGGEGTVKSPLEISVYNLAYKCSTQSKFFWNKF
jgi:hypothetical protein